MSRKYDRLKKYTKKFYRAKMSLERHQHRADVKLSADEGWALSWVSYRLDVGNESRTVQIVDTNRILTDDSYELSMSEPSQN